MLLRIEKSGGCQGLSEVKQMNDANQNKGIPKWLLYGLIAKGIIITSVVIGVLWYAGVI